MVDGYIGYLILDTGYWMPDTGSWILDMKLTAEFRTARLQDSLTARFLDCKAAGLHLIE